MRYNLQLTTAAGQVELLSLEELAEKFAIHTINNSSVTNVTYPGNQLFQTSREIFNSQVFQDLTYSTKTEDLVPFFKFSIFDQLRDIKPLREIVQEKIYEFVKKVPSKGIIRDLTLQEIFDLVDSLIEHRHFGKDLIGVDYKLGKYQKFFILLDPSCFEFFLHHGSSYGFEGETTRYAGKLIEKHPHLWCMYRYENSSYLEKLQETGIGTTDGLQ